MRREPDLTTSQGGREGRVRGRDGKAVTDAFLPTPRDAEARAQHRPSLWPVREAGRLMLE